jgi:hypothetical protein
MNYLIRSLITRPALVLAAAIVTACAPSVDMPKGTSKGFHSARLIQRDPQAPAITNATERQIHGMIQSALAKQFTANGLAWDKGDADLVVAYMVIYQETGMTTSYDDYFGYGRNASEIAEVVHTRGVIKSNRPDYFRQAGILVDVIDARTNKLVFRNLAKGDVVTGASPATRASRINAGVAQALEPFFR